MHTLLNNVNLKYVKYKAVCYKTYAAQPELDARLRQQLLKLYPPYCLFSDSGPGGLSSYPDSVRDETARRWERRLMWLRFALSSIGRGTRRLRPTAPYARLTDREIIWITFASASTCSFDHAGLGIVTVIALADLIEANGVTLLCNPIMSRF
ncbi:hypothetical protein EVAR_77112_1 [Eumeta japonica]|uniref:Uncharacterized protein n=1 Tax=Eumeta variegata TaxID=151549 RepID=A0A4C1T4L7_EUMVA|nr:hypothetical protein EVAR_77112_1 [Eumeta japonica]